MNDSGALDDLDRALIESLGVDARVSNRRIAQALGVTEGTVRGRIKRMQDEGIIAFTAITGLELAQKTRLSFIGVNALPARQREVANAIAQMAEINAVLLCFGEFDILAICLFDELSELVTITSERIVGMEGVLQVEPAIAIDTIKYNTGFARITEIQPSSNRVDQT